MEFWCYISRENLLEFSAWTEEECIKYYYNTMLIYDDNYNTMLIYEDFDEKIGINNIEEAQDMENRSKLYEYMEEYHGRIMRGILPKLETNSISQINGGTHSFVFNNIKNVRN